MKLILAALALVACLAAPAFASGDIQVAQIQMGAIDSSKIGNYISTATVKGAALKNYAIQVTGIGAAASAWSVAVDVSLDGIGWTEIMRHVTGDGDGTVKASTQTVTIPATWIRLRPISFSLGATATRLSMSVIGTQ